MVFRTKLYLCALFINGFAGLASYAQDLPPLIEQEYLFPGFMAISQGDPTRASSAEIAIDALHALQAIADHPANCIGDNGTVVGFTSTVESVTTNGFGVQVDSEVKRFESGLEVRREFAPWVRKNIRFFNSNPLSGVNNGVRELISENGCYGDAYRRLEAGLATAFNVTLEVTRPPALEIGDWKSFVDTCVPAYGQIYAAQDRNVAERTLSLICVCVEHAARQVGDAAFYEAARIGVGDALQTKPDGYGSTFANCFNSRQPNEANLRYEEYIQANDF